MNNFDWSGIAVKAGAAIVILIITWILARVVKSLLSKLLGRVKVLQRSGGGNHSLAESLGNVGSLIVWLLGLTAILNLFELTQVLGPIQSLLAGVLGALPRVLGAAVIFIVGVMLARVVRELVTAALRGTRVDERLQSLSRRATQGSAQQGQYAQGDPQYAQQDPATVDPETGATRRMPSGPAAGGPAGGPGGGPAGGMQISNLVGQILYALIIVVMSIAALQVLAIQAISEPATQMLSTILDAIPLILGAGILLAIGVIIARFIGGLLDSMMRGFGLERTIGQLGIDGANAVTVITRIVQVAIVLFFGIAATRMLNFPQITEMLNAILALGGRVLFGGVVIAAGIFLAGLLARTIGGGPVAQIVRWATIVLFAAMGLKYMGLADSIVNLAFGALVVGGAAAAALAYGLGGRDAAARQLNKLERKVDDAVQEERRRP
ncbi:mechanosensitive ion channel [Enemella evansiae]|uniref:mechanosensitive ion channel n=1 Tax=Enemella evansiae TaxID=2016499 RepID=UPI001E2E48B2|nr:mechanosensitive ion channel [Enemella evansiae]